MKVLLIGFSTIAKSRIITAFEKESRITQIEIASESQTNIKIDSYKLGKIYDNYALAISHSDADLVYISTINSNHMELAENALNKSFHVIIDKPAFINYQDAIKVVEIAKNKKKLLAEATVYAFHPQIDLMKNQFNIYDSQPNKITAIFSFPPLDKDNFRYHAKYGGGALNDLGPYAVSIGRVIFDSEPHELLCKICGRGGENNIETSFSMLAVYSGDRTMIGHFGFESEYKNYINIMGLKCTIESERIFTIPDNLENEITVEFSDDKKKVKSAKADCFELFIKNVLNSIDSYDHVTFSKILLSDARILNKLKISAKSEF